jgi:chromosome segregation ATPase
MEKGSFHTSEADEHVKNIPLPNQLPKGMDFSEIPVTALKSSTLETLISQNEDLMARLSIALRKNSEMEERISGYERDTQSLRTRFETLKEQYLVLFEKDRMATQRTTGLHDENIHLKVQIHKLEKGYTDIFVQAQAFQRRLQQLERYRARVQKAAASVKRQNKELKALRDALRETRGQQSTLMQSYEGKLNEASQQVEELRAKASERDRLFDEKIQVENELVFERRQFENYRNDAHDRLEKLNTEAADLRVQLKETLVDREGKTQDLERLQRELPALQLGNRALVEQVESLQALWSHKQREFEQLEDKNRNLQKLNQNISVTLNQQRKEIHGLKTELEQERFQAQDKTKTLLQEIQMLRDELAAKNS